jgi:sec-independent protein translocase protein TatA
MKMILGLFNLGGGEIILVLLLVLILFGARKIPELAKGLGQGIKEFKKATREVTDEIQNAVDDTNYSTLPPKDRQVEANVQPKLPDPSDPAKSAPVPQSTEHKA